MYHETLGKAGLEDPGLVPYSCPPPPPPGPVPCDNPGEIGTEPVCVGATVEFCESGHVGIATLGPMDGECIPEPDPELCGGGSVGVEPDCIALPTLCTEPEYGVEPVCEPLPTICGGDEVGIEPLCLPLPVPCDFPEVGIDDSCVDTLAFVPEGCGGDQVGFEPVCVTPDELMPEVCADGQVGFEPACVTPDELIPEDCAEGEIGFQPACIGVSVDPCGGAGVCVRVHFGSPVGKRPAVG